MRRSARAMATPVEPPSAIGCCELGQGTRLPPSPQTNGAPKAASRRAKPILRLMRHLAFRTPFSHPNKTPVTPLPTIFHEPLQIHAARARPPAPYHGK